jgi:glycosyltransferase involved in cell wall biosynthesis
MTTVLYDVQGAQNRAHPERGIARYVLELARGLTRVAPGLVGGWVHDPGLPLPPGVTALADHAPLVTTAHAALDEAGVYHVASPFEPWLTAAALLPERVRRPGVGIVVTVYDLIPLLFPHDYLTSTLGRVAYRRGIELTRTADRLLAISQATADDVVRLLDIGRGRVTVIGAGADERFRPPAAGPIGANDGVDPVLRSAFPGLRPGYVLVPSGMDPRKNWQGALAAYARLPSSLRAARQLVLACRVDDAQRAVVRRAAVELGVTSLVLTDVVDDDVLVALYRSAAVVVMASRYEGFGLPVLEARLCGAPVVCADNSSLREVLPDPVARFATDDVGAMAALLERALTDTTFRDALLAVEVPPFTWDRAARRTAAVYRELLGEGVR